MHSQSISVCIFLLSFLLCVCLSVSSTSIASLSGYLLCVVASRFLLCVSEPFGNRNGTTHARTVDLSVHGCIAAVAERRTHLRNVRVLQHCTFHFSCQCVCLPTHVTRLSAILAKQSDWKKLASATSLGWTRERLKVSEGSSRTLSPFT